jgi:hypothetical protein
VVVDFIYAPIHGHDGSVLVGGGFGFVLTKATSRISSAPFLERGGETPNPNGPV